jgi:hypothetical protein
MKATFLYFLEKDYTAQLQLERVLIKLLHQEHEHDQTTEKTADVGESIVHPTIAALVHNRVD